MPVRLGLFSAAILSVLAIHTHAFAQAPSPAERMVRAFNGFDADKDGYISRDEYMAVEAQVFARIDRNRDGMLSRDEVVTAGRGGDADPRAKAAREARFKAVDRNDDGTVTRAEYDAFSARIMAEHDQNKDNRLSRREFSALWSGAPAPRS